MAVPADRDEQTVREFKSFTEDLMAMADWLSACGIDFLEVALGRVGDASAKR